MTNKLIYSLLLSCLFSLTAQAEEWDEDEDLEHFFSTRQKSTINDFPLREIAGDELSDAAIVGALRANTSSNLSAKPIYEQEQDDSDKEKETEVIETEELRRLGSDLPLNSIPISAPELQLPVYQLDTGRVYGGHHTHTVERP